MIGNPAPLATGLLPRLRRIVIHEYMGTTGNAWGNITSAKKSPITKLYEYIKPQICGRCANEGHCSGNCTGAVLRCVPGRGHRESFNKNCRNLYPSHDEYDFSHVATTC